MFQLLSCSAAKTSDRPSGLKRTRAFLPRRVRDPLGDAAVHAGHEDLAAEHVGELLAVRRERRLGEAVVDRDDAVARAAALLGNLNRDLAGVAAGLERVHLAVVREAQRAGRRARQEPDGISREVGERGGLRRIGQRALVDVERPALLAQVVEVVPVGVEHGIPVLAVELGQLAVLRRLEVVHPDIARDRRGVVLPPVALVALDVVINQLPARGVGRCVQRRRGQHLGDAAAGDGDGVELRHDADRELRVGRPLLAVAGEQHRLVVGREAAGDLVGGVERQPRRLAAGRRHDEHVEVAVPVRRERDALAVVAPDGRELVGLAERLRQSPCPPRPAPRRCRPCSRTESSARPARWRCSAARAERASGAALATGRTQHETSSRPTRTWARVLRKPGIGSLRA